jgi:hypothetical protein
LNTNLVKYGIISIIGIILIYQFLPIGDYCSGLLNFLHSLFLVGLLIIIIFVLAIRNLIQIKKRKIKFDFIPLILVLFFGTMWYFLVNMTDKKFWTDKSLIGFVEIEGTPKSGTLVLFNNGSFGASHHHADYSCTYQGDYEIIDNLLILKRADLSELTDKVFTTEYLINRTDSILKPKKNGFMTIGISKITE